MFCILFITSLGLFMLKESRRWEWSPFYIPWFSVIDSELSHQNQNGEIKWLLLLLFKPFYHPLQEEIRQVFDGSCRLIPIKLVSDECIDLANDFIPELIDTLASQMNPQMVCATAGLCNSVVVDKLLLEYKVWKLRKRKSGGNKVILGCV